MADLVSASVVRLPIPGYAHLYTGRDRRCVKCRAIKPHTEEYFRGGFNRGQRGKKDAPYVKAICRDCEHRNRTEARRKREDAGLAIKQFSPDRFEKYRANNLKKYGISIEQYNILLEAQGNKCAICRTDNNGMHQSGRNKAFAVDHCHSTGKVRGLLCSSCNHGLGELRDDPDLLRVAIAYLERHK